MITTILLTTVHVIVCLFLIVVVLLQSGKAADLAGAFGGMGSQTAFGPRGSATLLSKATTISAILFMFTSMALSIMATRGTGGGGGTTSMEKHPGKVTAPVNQAPIQLPPAPVAPAPANSAPPKTTPAPAPAQTPAPAPAKK